MSVFVEPLDIGGNGPRVGIKDTIDVAGVRTRAGCRALESVAAARTNADVVEGLLAAGYHLAGKTNLHELAFGTTGINAGAGTITLANASNDWQGAVSLTGAATQVTDTNALTLGTLAGLGQGECSQRPKPHFALLARNGETEDPTLGPRSAHLQIEVCPVRVVARL